MKKNRRILIVMPCDDLPVPAVKGGAISTLVESIMKVNEEFKTVDLSIITTVNNESLEKSRTHYPQTTIIPILIKVFIKKLDSYLSSRNILQKLYVIKFVSDHLKKVDYDAIVLQNSGYLLKIFKNNFLLDKYEGKIFYHLHNDVPTNIDVGVLNKCKLLLISKYLQCKLVEIAGDSILKNCVVVKNGIDISRFSNVISIEDRLKIREKWHVSTNTKVILFVGRITPEKGINELINAVSSCKDDDVKLIIVGSVNFGAKGKSKFENDIMEKCRNLGDLVLFTGYVHNSFLYKYYKSADIIILPSIWNEPAGLTMLEALACGMPLITTNAGGIPEYVDERYAILLNNDHSICSNIVMTIKQYIKGEIKKATTLETENYVSTFFSEEVFYQNFIKSIK